MSGIVESLHNAVNSGLHVKTRLGRHGLWHC